MHVQQPHSYRPHFSCIPDLLGSIAATKQAAKTGAGEVIEVLFNKTPQQVAKVAASIFAFFSATNKKDQFFHRRANEVISPSGKGVLHEN